MNGMNPPYAKWREELNTMIADARDLPGQLASTVVDQGTYLEVIKVRLLLDIAVSLDRIADNLLLVASKP